MKNAILRCPGLRCMGLGLPQKPSWQLLRGNSSAIFNDRLCMCIYCIYIYRITYTYTHIHTIVIKKGTDRNKHLGNFMRCAEGIFVKGILGCTGFPLLQWEKGSETPSCGGEKGLRLPRSLGRSMRNEGVSDPFPHRKRESQTLFPIARGSLRPFFPPQKGNPVHPQIPLGKIPLAQRIRIICLKITVSVS